MRRSVAVINSRPLRSGWQSPRREHAAYLLYAAVRDV